LRGCGSTGAGSLVVHEDDLLVGTGGACGALLVNRDLARATADLLGVACAWCVAGAYATVGWEDGLIECFAAVASIWYYQFKILREKERVIEETHSFAYSTPAYGAPCPWQ
jgi:hypothetical protein